MKTYLSDRQKLVLECVYKEYTTRQSLDYLKAEGFDISEKTFHRDKNFIKKNSLVRLFQLGKIDFRSFHQERLEEIKMLKTEMYRNYNKITDPYKKILASERIINLIPIISAYEDTAQYVIEKSNTHKEQVPTLSI